MKIGDRVRFANHNDENYVTSQPEFKEKGTIVDIVSNNKIYVVEGDDGNVYLWKVNIPTSTPYYGLIKNE